ncbi:MAG: alpha-glucosidase [Rhodospirillales bacterium]|nr:alpha-glucosidase [Rhodospirillales bacterium]
MERNWWRGAVMYQIYPRSFKDTKGNGVGDLKGIIEKLDYVASLGVEGVWISPFFKSPMKDFGYDVSDYRDVDPLFGTLNDFHLLLDKAHKLELKIIIDLVLNHTSEEHPWFLESRQDQTNPKADWYVWADPKPDGTPSNNWLSIFGGSAWQFDVFRGQYYLHNFLKEQPDLNYHNENVVKAVLDECRYWLDMGVDGLRLDVINFCTHDKSLRDNPAKQELSASSQLDFPDTYSMQSHVYDKSRPENYDFLRKLRALLDEYPDRMALAEIGDDDPVKLSVSYTASPDLLHTAYSFAFMMNKGKIPTPSFFKKAILDQQSFDGESWPSWAFSNHDVMRAATRWSGTDFDHDPKLSRLLIVLLCSLRGTAFLYQGEELGLPEVQISYEDVQDPWGKYLYKKWQGRDGCRTPMPWSANDTSAGFSSSEKCWLPISEQHIPLSVSEQETQPDSLLRFTRSFLAWRKGCASIRWGNIQFVEEYAEPVLAFIRNEKGESMLCLFNLSEQECSVPLPAKAVLAFEASKAEIKAEKCILPPYGFSFFRL